jgi:hypothetical protein
VKNIKIGLRMSVSVSNDGKIPAQAHQEHFQHCIICSYRRPGAGTAPFLMELQVGEIKHAAWSKLGNENASHQ